MTWKLETKNGPPVILKPGACTIGKSGCFLNIEDKKISKLHCTIYINDEQAILVDNNSSNGTFVNGSKVLTKELVHLDNIVIGMTKLKVVKIEDNL
jgi:pSer/pThr/pTyr-binding forkhead associated (FHA) protein